MSTKNSLANIKQELLISLQHDQQTILSVGLSLPDDNLSTGDKATINNSYSNTIHG
jgi:hypothetical protein